ncbi:MAG: reverse transcriptase domain-containing protein, partial [Verrucomicrobiota bacterium]|nr:reverse transcriptase domain-containing protein [Verrucomicrobiota bacterium]
MKAARQGFLGHLLEKVNPFNTFELFKLATRLQQGLGLQRNPRVRAMALTEDVVRAHFQKIWTIRRDGVDVSVMEQLKQRPLRPDLDCEPSLLEVRDFLKKAKMGVGTADSELPAEFCGTLLKDEAALSILVNLLVKIWRSGTWEGHRRPMHVDRHSLLGWNGWGARKKLRAAREFGLRVAWMQENPKRPGSRSHARYEMYKSATTLEEARNLLRDGSWTEKDVSWDLDRGYLKIFPQSMHLNIRYVTAEDTPEEWPEEWKVMKGVPVYKGVGDPSAPDNYRMVMVGDFAQSVLGGVMLSRLESVVAEFGMEIQNGGVKGRGGMDAIFTLKQVLFKRRQHGQNTWGTFVDLKKAFPSIPRHVLFGVLRKFGVPPHFIQVLKRFYTGLMVRVTLGPNTSFDMPAGETGVREGCRLSPTLFVLVMQAVCELVEPLWKGALSFRTCLDKSCQTVRGKSASRRGT